MIRLMRRGASELDLTRLFTVVIAEANITGPPSPHEWAVERYASINSLVADALRTAQQRGLLRTDIDVTEIAGTLLAAMDGLELRHVLTPHDMRIERAFARLAGQILSDVGTDDPQAQQKIAAWRARHARDMTLGVGIVGLSASGGWAATAHVPALAAVDGIELRGLVGSSPASARAAGEAFGVPAYESVAALADEVDLVVIAVKVPRHRELLLPALAAGTAVLSEWPLAVDLPEAEELALAASRTRSFVGLQGRSLPTFRWLADLVREGYVGEILSTTVVASTAGWGAEVSERMRYTLDRESGATMLTIAFGHAIDVVTMVVGELDDVMATTATRRPRVSLAGTEHTLPMTAEDQIAISGTLPGGAVLSAHYRGGTLAGPGFSMVIDGTEGTLEVTTPTHPHLARITVLGARGSAPLAQADAARALRQRPGVSRHTSPLAETRLHRHSRRPPARHRARSGLHPRRPAPPAPGRHPTVSHHGTTSPAGPATTIRRTSEQ